ncbi:NUDIX domain-containing protein [Massilia sp. CCM 8695]|uniref:NUDIX domain-containing protein n=1 Tax=Massilia frigida TaxID=2609281 RepID=A0ABX0NDG4_9BURK|nr:NUDIX domain-containing protein [Massilia frigida]NHZ83491.1 NUDIX domain-containing protein [Massilia frigida]
MSTADLTEQEYLASYNIHAFDVPLTSVDLVIFTVREQALHVLLVQRGAHPAKGQWALPGGFIDVRRDVDLDATALRKLREKTGVSAPYLEQLQGFGSSTRDPRGWSATFAYFALIGSDQIELQHGAGADAACWHSISEHGADIDLAFDHAMIVATAVQRLRNKVEYTSLPAHLLAEEFTLSDLQRVYEIVLGRPIDKSAFRKRVKEGDFLEEITGKQRHGSNRPAQLYRIRSGQPTVFFSRTMGA